MYKEELKKWSTEPTTEKECLKVIVMFTKTIAILMVVMVAMFLYFLLAASGLI